MIDGVIFPLATGQPPGMPLDGWAHESAMWLDLVQLAAIFNTDPFAFDDWVFHRGWIPRMKQHRVWVPAEAAVQQARAVGADDLARWLAARAEKAE